MMVEDSDGWKYKKLEEAEGDSSDNTTTDEHKKTLNQPDHGQYYSYITICSCIISKGPNFMVYTLEK